MSSPRVYLWKVDLINKLSETQDIHLFANFEEAEIDKSLFNPSISIIHLPIIRKINLKGDIKALCLLIFYLYKLKLSSVHSITPKAGLLSMIAGFLCRIPNRIHTFTGQVWSTKNFILRSILKGFDRIIVLFSTQIIVDSLSQRNFLEVNRILKPGQGIVFGKGSISGIDTNRFKYDQVLRNKLRLKYDVNNCCVILFVGRLNQDKGLHELIKAFETLNSMFEGLKLWIVGEDEDSIRETYANNHNVTFFGYSSKPEEFMLASDIFCLPSYREGFGNVVIESSACGLPSVVSDIYGLQDSIINGETGLFCKPRSSESLVKKLGHLIENEDLRLKIGEAARKRSVEDFSQKKLTEFYMNFYRGLIDGY